MMRRVLDDEGSAPPSTSYDCIVVDECHRGYTLDKEMSDDELTFRDQRDYVSRYRKVDRVLRRGEDRAHRHPRAAHHRDLRPARLPVHLHPGRLDKVLVPQEPPFRIVTELSRDGIKYASARRSRDTTGPPARSSSRPPPTSSTSRSTPSTAR
jgi:type I restriction enzyme R subunit